MCIINLHRPKKLSYKYLNIWTIEIILQFIDNKVLVISKHEQCLTAVINKEIQI